MKQRAIKRCIKRTHNQLRRGTFKGRTVEVSHKMAGSILAFDTLTQAALYVTKDNIMYKNRWSTDFNGGHMHWLGNPDSAVAVSYVK